MVPVWITLLIIVAAGLVLGWLIVSRFCGARPLVGDQLTTFLAAITLGLAPLGWAALLLAELGWFSLGRLALIWLLLVGPLLPGWLRARGAPRPAHPPWSRLEFLFLAIWLPLASWLFFRPHQFVVGGADAGVYVNLSASITNSGSLLIEDELLADLDPALLPALLRPLPASSAAPYYLLPGFYVTEATTGEITPQFYALHPVWQAIAFSFGGNVQAALAMTGLWALLSCLAIYALVRELTGWPAAALALLALTLNGLQIWFARYPTSEALSQYLLWVGLWGSVLWLRDRQPARLWAALSGSALGLFFLTRIDALFMLPLLLGLGLVLWAARRWRQDAWYFFTPLALLVIHSLIHALWQSRPYFLGLFAFALTLVERYETAVLGAALLIVLAGVLWRLYPISLAHIKQPARLVSIGLLLALAVYAWFIWPQIAPAAARADVYTPGQIPILDHENLLRLGWYLSPLGVWLGITGICLLMWRERGPTVILLAISLFYTVFYLWNIRNNPIQVYAMRRYVPATLPFFTIGATLAVHWVAQRRRPKAPLAAAIVGVLWLVWTGWSAQGLITQIDYQGILPQLNGLNAELAPGSVLIFDHQAAVTQGDVLGTPLRFLYGHNVLPLRDPALLNVPKMEETIQRWQAAGRTVYWIQHPAAPGSLPAAWPATAVHRFQVSALNLEAIYAGRPQQLLPFMQQGEVLEISPLPPPGE